jgi:hypothetical protein
VLPEAIDLVRGGERLTLSRGSLGWNVSSNGRKGPFLHTCRGFALVIHIICLCSSVIVVKSEIQKSWNTQPRRSIPFTLGLTRYYPPRAAHQRARLRRLKPDAYVGASPGYAHRQGFGTVAAVQRNSQSNLQRSTSLSVIDLRLTVYEARTTDTKYH